MYEFYTNDVVKGSLFATFVCGVSMHLSVKDIARILGIPFGGWDHYVKFDWPPL